MTITRGIKINLVLIKFINPLVPAYPAKVGGSYQHKMITPLTGNPLHQTPTHSNVTLRYWQEMSPWSASKHLIGQSSTVLCSHWLNLTSLLSLTGLPPSRLPHFITIIIYFLTALNTGY